MASTYLAPGIYIEETRTGARVIEAVGTSTAGFVGIAPVANARVNELTAIRSWSEFATTFLEEGSTSTPLSHAVHGFFANGGGYCYVVNIADAGSLTGKGSKRSGLDVLETAEDIAIVAAPGYTDPSSYDAVLTHAEKNKDRIAILDAPANVRTVSSLTKVGTASARPRGGARRAEEGEPGGGEEGGVAAGRGEADEGGVRPRNSDDGFGALYSPMITVRDPVRPRDLVDVHPSGHIAGIYARTDSARGVHKAPANEPILGALNVSYRYTREEQGILNLAGVNAIRFFPREGIRVYGARTLAASSSEWKYVNVRRLFIMVEQSIARSTGWVVFEPNDRSLWKSIRRDVSAFLRTLWRDGALMGRTPEEAFFVKCDEETNPPESIDAGRVVIVIGVAPVKPAEFVIFRIGQQASGPVIEG
jgi:hypothetical protein